MSDLIKKNFKKPWIDGSFFPLSYLRSSDDFGIGDLESLEKMIQFSKELGHNLVEVLPLTMSSAFNSPYSVLSSKLFDPIYLSIEWLREFISAFEFNHLNISFENERDELKSLNSLNFDRVRALKENYFSCAYKGFKSSNSCEKEFLAFKNYHSNWLKDHLLFVILRKEFLKKDPSRGWDFRTWPSKIKKRDKSTIEKLKAKHSEQIDYLSFLQWQFHKQWKRVQISAQKANIGIMGDIPYSVDGADIWLNFDVFNLKSPSYKRLYTQGVPPDFFSDFGQYWQFYPYHWKNKNTRAFLMERLEWHFEFFKVLRLDHVLGYYRSYLFSEDSNNQLSLEKLNIYDQLIEEREKGFKDSSYREEATWKVYQLFLKALKKKRGAFGKMLKDTFFSKEQKFCLQEDAMLLIARKMRNEVKEPWIYQYTVEKAIHNNEPNWEYLKISKTDGYQHLAHLAYYLFFDERIPEKEDSIRPCFFDYGYGEDLLQEMLQKANKNNIVLISEALGVVPQFVVDSLERIGLPNYIPTIYGMTPESPSNPYFPPNHEKNAFVTFALHDSLTMKTWWESMKIDEKKEVYKYLFGKLDNFEHHIDLTDVIKYELLKQLYKSKAQMKVMIWTDILTTPQEQGINKPGQQMGQWEARMPLDLNVELLLKASKKKKVPSFVKQIVSLLKRLHKSS